mgnify:CR=1 FL=1|tara:strand:- start:9454 stop:11814 length:2361 start_codon:yes stop_codon:yes gene_type:complete
MDFETQIEALTGLTIGSGVTTSQLSQFLKDGVIDVTSRCVTLKPEESDKFAKASSEQTGNGLDLNGARIVSVVRETGTDGDWRSCRQIPVDLQSRVTDSSSIHYASKFNPAFSVLDNGQISVFPVPGSSNNGFKAYYVNNVPQDKGGDSLIHSHSDIKYFDDSKVYLVVIYAGIKSLDYMVDSAQDSLPSNISDIVITSISESLPSFVTPSSYVLPVKPAGANVDVSEIGSIASYIIPVFENISLGSFSSISLPNVPTKPSSTASTVTLSGTEPTYTKPSLTLSSSPGIANLTVPASSVSAPTIASKNTMSFETNPPNFIAPIISLTSVPTISDLSISSSAPSSPVLKTITLEFSQAAPTFTAPVTSPKFYDADTWINTEEDSEMSAARMQVISGQIQKYQADIQNALNEFNEDNAAYQIEFQKSVQNAQLLDKNDAQSVQLYQAELGEYQQNVNKEIQTFQQNMTKDIQLWEKERATDIQKYQADIQVALNEFNKENAEYQIEFQRSAANHKADDVFDSNKLQKYQIDITEYQALVNSSVQEYQQSTNSQIKSWETRNANLLQQYQLDLQNELNEFNKENAKYQAEVQKDLQDAKMSDDNKARLIQIYQSELQSYQAEVNTEIQRWQAEVYAPTFNEWQQRFQGSITNYSADIQKETARVNSSVQEYQTKLNKALQTYQSETGYDINLYTAEIQANLQKFANDLNKENTEFTANLGKYTQEVSKVTSENQSRIAKYNAEIQNYAAQVQKVKIDIDLYHQRSMKLQQQYDAAFTLMYPAQQKQGRQ